jgi:ATP synthase protein I
MTEPHNRPPLPPDDNPWRAAGLVSAIGIVLALMLGAGWWIGNAYDNNHGTRFGYLVGLLVGLAIGIAAVALLIRKYTGARKK